MATQRILLVTLFAQLHFQQLHDVFKTWAA